MRPLASRESSRIFWFSFRIEMLAFDPLVTLTLPQQPPVLEAPPELRR